MAIEVQTTQNVIIDYEPAGLGYRLLAYIVDILVMTLWIVGWYFFIVELFPIWPYIWNHYFNSLGVLFIICILFPVIFYNLLFDTLNNGQTLGKMLFKIKVVNLDGTKPSFGSYLLRWLFRLIDITLTEGMMAVILIGFSEKKQRLGDIVAGTTVIDLKPGNQNKVPTIADLDFEDNYQVKYTDVLDKLSDRDIQVITSMIKDRKFIKDKNNCKRLTERVLSITGYSLEGSDIAFLNKVVDDYNYLALQ